MSNFHSARQDGENNIQSHQQLLRYKQLHALQRQQVEELIHGSRPQNTVSPIDSLDQMSGMLNEVLPSDFSGHLYPNSTLGNDVRLLHNQMSNSSYMDIDGMNREQSRGISANNLSNFNMLTNNQAQSMKTLWLGPQVDQSLCSSPASNFRGFGNQHSHFLGTSDDHRTMKRAGDQSEAFSAFGDDQALAQKGLFGGVVSNSLRNSEGNVIQHNFTSQSYTANVNAELGDIVPSRNLQHIIKEREFCGTRNQQFWTENPREQLVLQQDMSARTSLDPTEQKILFGDEGTNWCGLLGKNTDQPLGGYGQASALQQNDKFNGFPSLQSGSWSALMQEALEASTSDNGQKAECSGLQRTEPPVATCFTMSNKNGNTLEFNLHGLPSLVSKPFPLQKNTQDASFVSTSQHSIRSPLENREQTSTESCAAPLNYQQVNVESNNRYFYESINPNQTEVDYLREQMQSSNGMRTRHTTELPENNLPSLTKFQVQGHQGFWNPQQPILMQNLSNHSGGNAIPDQIVNNLLTKNVSDTAIFNRNNGNHSSPKDGPLQPKPGGNHFGGQFPMADCNMRKVNENNGQLLIGRGHINYNDSKIDSSSGFKDVEDTGQWTGASQILESFREKNVRSDVDEQNDEFLFSRSGHIQHMSSGFSGRGNFSIGELDDQPQSCGKHFMRQSSQQRTDFCTLQNHPTGSGGMNFGDCAPDPPRQSQVKRASVFHGSSSAFFCQNRVTQQSKNMLELLHQTDASNENNANAESGMLNHGCHNTSSNWQLKPYLHGCGLQLAPPSQGQQHSSGYSLSGQSSLEELVDKDQGQITSPSSSQSVPPICGSQPTGYYPSEADNSRKMAVGFSQFSSVGSQPHVSVIDSKPDLQISIPSQGEAGSMFKNVWANSLAQGKPYPQQNKILSNELHSMYSNYNPGPNSWGFQNGVYQEEKGEGTQPGIGKAHLQNHEMQNVGYSAKQNVIKMHTASSSPMHQQDTTYEKQEDSNNSLNASITKPSCGHNFVQGCAIGSFDAQQPKYSLLHQLQTMQCANIDARVEGRQNKFGTSLDTLPSSSQAGPSSAYNEVLEDNKISRAEQNVFRTDLQMPGFSSKDSKYGLCLNQPEKNSLHDSGETGMNGHRASLDNPSTSVSLPEKNGGQKHGPQMDPSWFEQYSAYKNGQNLSISHDQKCSSHQFHKVSSSMNYNLIEERPGNTESNHEHDTTCTKDCKILSHSHASTLATQRQKKRKLTTVLLPWHKITEEQGVVRDIRMGEVDWACSTDRLIEKTDNDAEWPEDITFHPARRRLALTTQLTHQIFAAIPAVVIKEKAALSFASITYYSARLGLGEGCSMIFCAGTTPSNLPCGNFCNQRNKNLQKMGDSCLGDLVESFIEKIKKTEDDFARLTKRSPFLDIQLECQELERFSIVNRLGKFHIRNQADGADFSTSSNSWGRSFFQRHVFQVPMTGNIPEVVQCFSL